MKPKENTEIIIHVGWGLPHRSKQTAALEIGKVSPDILHGLAIVNDKGCPKFSWTGPKESVGEKVFVKCNDAGSWICLESVREISLFYIAVGTIAKIPDKNVNAYIQEEANRSGYDEIDLVLDGIDAASAKELAQDMIQKVFYPEGR